MKFLNRIELTGIVGYARTTRIANGSVTTLSVVTEHVRRNSDGTPVTEVTWHKVTVTDGAGCPDLDRIGKGSAVNVKGRIRTINYTDTDGNVRRDYDIVANSVTLLPIEN